MIHHLFPWGPLSSLEFPETYQIVTEYQIYSRNCVQCCWEISNKPKLHSFPPLFVSSIVIEVVVVKEEEKNKEKEKKRKEKAVYLVWVKSCVSCVSLCVYAYAQVHACVWTVSNYLVFPPCLSFILELFNFPLLF